MKTLSIIALLHSVVSFCLNTITRMRVGSTAPPQLVKPRSPLDGLGKRVDGTRWMPSDDGEFATRTTVVETRDQKYIGLFHLRRLKNTAIADDIAMHVPLEDRFESFKSARRMERDFHDMYRAWSQPTVPLTRLH